MAFATITVSLADLNVIADCLIAGNATATFGRAFSNVLYSYEAPVAPGSPDVIAEDTDSPRTIEATYTVGRRDPFKKQARALNVEVTKVSKPNRAGQVQVTVVGAPANVEKYRAVVVGNS